MRGALHQKLDNRSGFTLAETLTALAISAILLAITVVGVIEYSRNLKLTEMDGTAKEIFIAAQNHLTQGEASGQLKRYRKKALDETDTTVDRAALGTLMPDRAPSDAPSGIDWPSSNEDYYYIEYNTSAVSSADTLKGSILQYMLPFGAIDETVRSQGSYIIEYNVKTAAVYGVFYAEEGVSFNYSDVTALDNQGGRADTADGRHVRRDYSAGIIGYYGGAMAGDLMPSPTDELTLSIENKDRLKITVKDPNYFNKTIDDKGILQTHLTLTVKGKESGNEEVFALELKDSGVAPTKKEMGKDLWWDVKNIEIEDDAGRTKTGLEYTVILDDITRPGGHFADICPNLIPGEDVIVKAVSASATALASVKEAEAMTNSLFQSTAKSTAPGSKDLTASIGCLRHFENLDQDVSKLPQNTNPVKAGGQVLYQPQYLVRKAVQTADMSWNDYFGKDSEHKKSVYGAGLKETEADGKKLADGSYYGIKNDLLGQYDGQNHRISDVYIHNENPDSNQDSSESGKVNGGLIRYCQANLSVSNLVLKDFDVTAERNSAALIGEAQNAKSGKVTGLQISNVLVVGGSITSNYTRGNAGSLIGYTGTRTVVDRCGGSVKITAKGARFNADYAGDAGGLIGEIKSNGSEIRISNSYTGGQTVGGKYKTSAKTDYNVYGIDTAGGLIGKINGSGNTKISNCYSTCSAFVSDDESKKITGSAGGLVGKQRTGKTSYENCYAAGPVGGDQGAYVGAFIGYSEEGDVFQDCYFLKGMSQMDQASASTYLNLEKIKGYSYGEMPKTEGVVTTHNVDTALNGKVYPFKTVNRTGLTLTDNVNSVGVHYGDWQEPEEDTDPSDLMFAYRETDASGRDYWYIVKAEKKKNDEVEYVPVMDTLTQEKDVYIRDDYQYGFLWGGKGNLQKLFNNKEFKEYVESSTSSIKIDEKTYRFYGLNSKNPQDEKGVAKTPAPQKGKNPWMVFHYNPDFAAAIGRPADLGSQKLPYQVRTNKQLRNISSGKFAQVYRSCFFRQTADIKLSGEGFKAFGGEAFLGSYDAYSADGAGYRIFNFKQNVTSAEPAGLITKIGSTGWVSYVNLFAEIDITNPTTEAVGSLSGQLLGTVTSCHAEASINFVSSAGYSGDIGGLIGDVAGGAKMEGCSFKTPDYSGVNFRIKALNASALHIGGLAGDQSGEISNSEADVKLVLQISGNGQTYIGGLAGQVNTLGTVKDSEAKGSIEGDATEQSLLGGFVGAVDVTQNQGAAITGCRSRVNIENSAGKVKAGGFAGQVNVGRIENSWSKTLITNSGSGSYLGGFAGEIAAEGIVSQCWSKVLWRDTGKDIYLGGFVGHIISSAITNCYAVTVSEEAADMDVDHHTLFIGYARFIDHATVRDCHGLKVYRGRPMVSNSDFENHWIWPLKCENCYMLGNKYKMYITSVKSADDYRLQSTFKNLDFYHVWELANDQYPTLQENPES